MRIDIDIHIDTVNQARLAEAETDLERAKGFRALVKQLTAVVATQLPPFNKILRGIADILVGPRGDNAGGFVPPQPGPIPPYARGDVDFDTMGQPEIHEEPIVPNAPATPRNRAEAPPAPQFDEAGSMGWWNSCEVCGAVAGKPCRSEGLGLAPMLHSARVQADPDWAEVASFLHDFLHAESGEERSLGVESMKRKRDLTRALVRAGGVSRALQLYYPGGILPPDVAASFVNPENNAAMPQLKHVSAGILAMGQALGVAHPSLIALG